MSESLRHFGLCWYTAELPLTMPLLQARFFFRSRMFRRILAGPRFAYGARTMRRWSKLYAAARTSAGEPRRSTLRRVVRDFSLFAAATAELGDALGRAEAAELYSELFLETGAMEMDWLWPTAADFSAQSSPQAALWKYFEAYLRAYERIGVLELASGDEELIVKHSLFRELFDAFGTPELGDLVSIMETRALQSRARALGADAYGARGRGGEWRFVMQGGLRAAVGA